MSEFRRPNSASARLGGGGNPPIMKSKISYPLPGNLKKEYLSKLTAAVNHGHSHSVPTLYDELLANKPKANGQALLEPPLVALSKSTPQIPFPTSGSGSTERPLVDRYGKPLVHHPSDPSVRPFQHPRKLPLCLSTVVRLKYSRCIRSTLMSNNIREEKQLHIGCRVFEMVREILMVEQKLQRRLFVLRLRHEEMLKLKSEIEEVDSFQQSYQTIVNMCERDQANETIVAISILHQRLYVLPIRRSRIHKPIPTNALKKRVESFNFEIYRRYGTPIMATVARENLTIATQALKTTKRLNNSVLRLTNKFKILMSMLVQKERERIEIESGYKGSSDEEESEDGSIELSDTEMPALEETVTDVTENSSFYWRGWTMLRRYVHI